MMERWSLKSRLLVVLLCTGLLAGSPLRGQLVNFVGGISFSDLQSEFVDGGTYAGFRHVTLQEAWTHFQTEFNWNPGASPEENAQPAFNIIFSTPGLAYSSSYIVSIKGFVIEHGASMMAYYTWRQGSPEETATGRLEFNDPADHYDPATQEWAVHMITPVAVPEPAAVALLMGLVTLCRLRLRRS